VRIYIISVVCDIMEEHRVHLCNSDNNDNDDNVTCVSVWFELFGGLL
jgi:hypothetical protein